MKFPFGWEGRGNLACPSPIIFSSAQLALSNFTFYENISSKRIYESLNLGAMVFLVMWNWKKVKRNITWQNAGDNGRQGETSGKCMVRSRKSTSFENWACHFPATEIYSREALQVQHLFMYSQMVCIGKNSAYDTGFLRNYIFLSVCSVARLCLFGPKDCSLPGSPVHGIFQARILEWLPLPTPGDLPNPRIEPTSLVSPALAGGCFMTSITWEVPFLRIYIYI